MQIRRLGTDDVELASVTARRFKGDSVPVAAMCAFLAEPGHYLLVALDGDEPEPVGFLLAYRLARIDRPAAQLFVYEIEVDARHRRRGIGAALVARICEIGRGEGMSSVFLLTNRSNPDAVAFYRSTGGRFPNGDDLLVEYPADRAPLALTAATPGGEDGGEV